MADVARCRELGIAIYLIKPVRQSELLDAIAMLLGDPGGISTLDDKSTCSPLEQVPAQGTGRNLRILLAEDNPVNQKLAARTLEKQGHEVIVVGNGREALTILEQSEPSIWC